MNNINILSAKELNSLITHVTLCLTDRSKQNINHALNWAQWNTGFEGAVVCTLSRESHNFMINDFFNHSYDDKWINTYLAEGYSSVDPVISHSFSNSGVFSWQRAFSRARSSFPKTFLEAASDFGLRAGFAGTFTINNAEGRNARTLCSFANVDARRSRPASYIMNALMPAFHEILEHKNTPVIEQDIFLTPKEKEVLNWASVGKSIWDIGIITGISESTVKFHIRNVYRKLNVNNRAHAIARAVQLKLI